MTAFYDFGNTTTPTQQAQDAAWLRDATQLRTDQHRFGQKHLRTLDDVTIHSVGGRDGAHDNDFLLIVKRDNGERIVALLDQGRHQDSQAALNILHGKTNVFHENKNTPVQASLEGTFFQTADRHGSKWMFRITQGTFTLPTGETHTFGRPLHPKTHDVAAAEPKTTKTRRSFFTR